MCVDIGHPQISIYRQCELLSLARSSLYYKPVEVDDSFNVLLMRLIDEQFTKYPFYDVDKMTAWLKRNKHEVNHKRIRRLMRLMGLHAIYPKPNLSKAREEHKKYPYLLKGVHVARPNHVWMSDITYIRMSRGFMYLVAILDWYSRYVVSWKLSNSLDVEFCIDALDEALNIGRPSIFNSDQGSQYTSDEFTDSLKRADIQISMDGRGRFLDNIFVERLWRTVKYEEVYLHDYESVPEVINGLNTYFQFYNGERIHQSLSYLTPKEVYYGDFPVQ